MEPTQQGVATPERDYKSTMNLPTTEFPMRANSAQREPEFQARWDAQRIYDKVLARRAGAKTFMLHDGPPYLSSPNIHIGHALNRVLKDVVVKYHALAGYYAPFVPGYDCHGLPIENAVLKDVPDGRHSMTVLELREKCRGFAEQNLAGQQSRFRRLGILADWEHPYLTMDPKFEAKQIEVFGEMAQKGYIYRGLKPVYWCPNCETALAEAEVEYSDEHISPSIYVKFPLKMTSQAMVAKLAKINEPVYLVIWTTTPWTLPANLGISVHPKFKYTVLKTDKHGYLMVASELVERFLKETGLQGTPVTEFLGQELEMLQAQHPFLPRTSLVITGDHVTAEAGTGLVHTAPGHGLEDYEVGKKYKLPVLAPVNAKGVFTEEAGSLVAGQRYNKANAVITKHLADTGFLIQETAMKHSYPHCWRCHKPVIYRATEQWFASVEGFRELALQQIHDVKWIPPSGEVRIANMVENRSDWCISRQRSWGVPIPIFYCNGCNQHLLTPETIQRVQAVFAEEGSDAWWKHDAAHLLPDGTTCPGCGGADFRKEQDIMDVWFDSGSSHAAVLETREHLSWPADLYMEGTDQYRGWFQSSLLTAVSTRGRAPYRTVVTHGFVVDETGRKMSKSLGNVVEPAKVMEQYGADILRLWAASVDYTNDVRVSDNILKQMAEIYRKIRNTARFLLSNLYDFAPKDALPYGELEEVDRYALHRLNEVVSEVTEALERYEFYRFYQVVQNYCVVDLSSFYFDVLKDTLYAESAHGRKRRSAQTALHTILMTLTTLVAPVLSHLAEDVWNFLDDATREGRESVFFSDWPTVRPEWTDAELKTRWETVQRWRDVALKGLEEARKAKRIGSALEARVVLYPETDAMRTHLEGLTPEAIAQLLITSQARFARADEKPAEGAVEGAGVAVAIERAEGEKCQRCWVYSPAVGKSAAHPTLCDRCVGVLG
ncbi:MAG TPA: isoleucine--tRNA ligase [Oscillatoriaceae cyanobacterium]